MSTRTYELVYVVKPDATEEQVAELHTQVEQIVSRMGGTLEKPESPLAQSFGGRRRLAYEIAHHKEGIYVLDVITGSGELMKELDRRLKNVDLLLRHLVVRVDEHQRKAERARTKRVEESRRRRVARGLPPDRQPGEGPQTDDGDEGGDFEGVEAQS
ncbi:MAG: 30S ribosomal protein S6 [Vicinamibacterales bacterium]